MASWSMFFSDTEYFSQTMFLMGDNVMGPIGPIGSYYQIWLSGDNVFYGLLVGIPVSHSIRFFSSLSCTDTSYT